MEASNQTHRLRRSFSMPPNETIQVELRPLARSKEKEIVYEETNDEASNRLIPSSGSNFSITEFGNSRIIEDTQRNVNRFIMKNGKENIKHKQLREQMRFMRDFFNTMMDLNWTYMTLIFMGTYFVTWFIFGVLCYWVAYQNGDFILDETTGEKHKDLCFTDINNFISMFLYSIGTQTTIGFNQNPSEDCPGAMILLMIQMIVSICIEGALLSIIYLKAASPVKHINKLKFSNKAVICYRDDILCLLFRVCDPREQQTIESKIRVYMIADRTTQEGELLKTETELKLINNGQQIITWPVVICHIIDETSPLWHIKTATDLSASDFELYVSISGSSPSTAQVTEARTSYVPEEIHWGQRFVNIIDYDKLLERYVIDYSNFNTTIIVWKTSQIIFVYFRKNRAYLYENFLLIV